MVALAGVVETQLPALGLAYLVKASMEALVAGWIRTLARLAAVEVGLLKLVTRRRIARAATGAMESPQALLACQ